MKKEIIGNCELYLGDCYELLPSLAKADAIVTDPPYGMNLDTDFTSMKSKIKKNNNRTGRLWEKVEGDDKPFDPTPLLNRADQFVLFGADYYLQSLPQGGSLSIWDKRLSESADKMFGSCFETLWFYPARKKDIIRCKWAGIFGTEKEIEKCRLHPTQKPTLLMKSVILKLKNTPNVILDPFMGSGSTGVACVELGRKFIGIEINENYFDIACERIRLASLQEPLFTAAEISQGGGKPSGGELWD